MADIELFGTGESESVGFVALATVTEQYHPAFCLLLPRGWTWNIEPGTELDLWCQAVAWELSRVGIRVRELLLEFSPLTAQETLPDWEEVLGLPDCPNPPTTLAARQQAAFAKLTESIADNPEYFLRLAETLGYPNMVIQTLGDPFTCISDCIDSLFGWEGGWINAWTLIANDSTVNDATLECRVDFAKHAHTFVVFDFS